MAAKRRSRGSGSIRRRDRALYLRYRPPGQQRQVEEHFSRLEGESMKTYRARAEAELEKVTLGLAAGTRTAPTSRTIEELGASFLAAVRSEIKTRTYETYESRIRNYIVPALGSKKVAHLATEDIRAFKHYLLSFKVVGNRTMAVSTARETMGRFHDIINYAMDGEDSRQYWGITFDPWPRRRFNWPDERERPAPNTYLPYTIEEARRFVLATPQALRPQILCAILLMLRDGELRAMRWKHLNEEKGLYYVCETHSRQHEFTTTKTASSQAEVPVPKLVMRELREQRKRQSQVRLRKGSKWQDHGLIFTTSTGNVLPPNWYHVGPKSSISTAAEIRPVSLHTLRKTGASILESLGVSRAETQVALRHKRPSVTDTYVSIYMEQRQEHIEQLADLIDGTSIPHSALKVG
jgi:integrase